MKKLLYLSVLLSFILSSASAQNRPVRIPGKANQQSLNLLDDPKFKKPAIAFVPLQGDTRKGYDPEKVYTWTDPSNPRKKYSAKGKDILAQVNEIEKSMNERGHSLREKKPFIQLNLTLPSIAKNDLNKCIIKNQVNKSLVTSVNTPGKSPGVINIVKPVFRNRPAMPRTVPNPVLIYTGWIETAAEFRTGTLSNTSLLERRGSAVYTRLMMVIPSAVYDKTTNCTLELSETENGNAFTTVKVNIKSPDKVAYINNGYNITYEDCERPATAKDLPLKIYSVNLSSSGYSFPAAGDNPKFYYTRIKFYDAAGKIIETYQPNAIALNNQTPMPVNIPSSSKQAYNGFNYELLDPGLHAFGFYASSGGFQSSSFKTGIGRNGVKKTAEVSGDMKVGVKYYNFRHLVNGNEPLSEEFVLFGYKISSEEKYNKGDGMPGIRVPGTKQDPDYGVVTLLDKEYDLRSSASNYFEAPIAGMTVTDMRFFIGPIPCRITVDISGKASIKVDYSSSSNCDIKTTITPRAEVNLNASGGVDAYNIAYAKVVAGINLLTIEMPYTLEANAEANKSVINPVLTVGGLSGQIYFQAGLCIPIPFVDDICTDFRVDILNWRGLEKSLRVDPVKGIVL